jgi:hypothetical protein
LQQVARGLEAAFVVAAAAGTASRQGFESRRDPAFWTDDVMLPRKALQALFIKQQRIPQEHHEDMQANKAHFVLLSLVSKECVAVALKPLLL